MIIYLNRSTLHFVQHFIGHTYLEHKNPDKLPLS